MKKIFLVSLLSLLLVTSPVSSVLAQNNQTRIPLDDPYQEYTYILNQFYSSRKEYDNARSKYLSYQTEQSKSDAIKATRTMLENGRQSILLYVGLISDYLLSQEELSQRVKGAILQDLKNHQEFLAAAKDPINKITDFNESKDAADSLNLRFNYIKTTAAESLNYVDAVMVKKQIDNSRVVVAQFSSIITGYPQDNRLKNIVDNWVSGVTTEITSNENDLNTFIETIYPLPSETTIQPGYQLGRTGSTEKLNQIKSKQQSYINKFKEMNTTIKKAYTEL